MTDDQRARNIIDLLRSVMYSGDNGNHTLLAEIEDLAHQLNEYDQIASPVDTNVNRLIQIAKMLKKTSPNMRHIIEHLND